MEYILDVAKWRCGGDFDEPNHLGEGPTYMLNDEGYMCCLGQFAKQAGVEDIELTERGTPGAVSRGLGKVYDPLFIDKHYTNQAIVEKLIHVNDDPLIYPTQKIQMIRELLEEEGHTLKVVNEDILEH